MQIRERELARQSHVSLEKLFEKLKGDTLRIILKTDVGGSLEVLKKEIADLAHPERGLVNWAGKRLFIKMRDRHARDTAARDADVNAGVGDVTLGAGDDRLDRYRMGGLGDDRSDDDQ